MSFKREGDDKSLLNVLRKRRVQELFAEKIPENEAHMLSNGKFTCTVCQYKPVFDTVQVLAQHRSGKKHLENVKRTEEKNKELQELIKIRQQEHFLQNGSTVLPGVCQVSSTANLLPNSPYDARALKNKIKFQDRKPTIDLTNSSADPKQPYLGVAKIPFCFSKIPAEKSESLKPYSRKREIKDESPSLLSIEDSLSSKPKVEQLSLKNTDPFMKKAKWDNFNANLAKRKCPKLKSASNSLVDRKLSFTLPAKETMLKVTDPQKKGLDYKYWQIAGSGWKKDWAGKWEKDEEAEFDSDEEPPNLD